MSMARTVQNAGMDLGVTIFQTDKTMPVMDLARAVEDRGFESLWVAEHTHIPVSRATPYPQGGELPDEYSRTLDPFVTLSAAAAVTERLKLGTAICLVAQHDTIDLAKSVASVDHVSGGRFLFGVGYGWNVEEMRDHGIEPKQRRAVVREKLLAARGLWTDDVAGFDGEHVQISPSWLWPKPVQNPHPPILFGGRAGPTLFRHIVELGAGWIPIGGGGLREPLGELRKLMEEAGRDPDTLDITTVGVTPDSLDKLRHYESMGITRVVFFLPPAGADVVVPILDRYVENFLAPLR
jgi:probable F420-dependent oxidoreductase